MAPKNPEKSDGAEKQAAEKKGKKEGKKMTGKSSPAATKTKRIKRRKEHYGTYIYKVMS